METVNYGTFSESVHRGAATERLPLSGGPSRSPAAVRSPAPTATTICPWPIATREVAS